MPDLDRAIAAAHDWNSHRGQISGSLASKRKYDAEGAQLLRKLTAALDAARSEAVAWVPVVGFEGVYEVSSAGLVRRIDSGKILSTAAKAGDGYVKCDLYKSGARTQTYLHRVVCEAFHGPADGRQVNHKDGDKENNAASNLEWVSSSENVNHSYYVLGNNVSPVEAYDHSHGQEALSFESVEQAVRSGFDSAHIYRCINNANKRHGGYRWRFTKAAPPAAMAVPAANVTPMRQPRADLARLVESINAAVYANGDGLSVTEAIGALELAKLELLKEQEQ